MKNPANSNIYEVNALGVLDAYAGYVEGSPEDVLLVIADDAQSNEVRAAVASSAARLGFGDAVAWVNVNGTDLPLGAKELMAIVEGVDPLALVVLDAESARLTAEAYRCELVPDTHAHVFGRPTVAFGNFCAMLNTEEGKQRAWHLLKALSAS